MLDIILIICIIVLVVGGILSLILPADKLVNKDKLKDGETMEETAKKMKKNGILYLGLALILLVFNFII